MIMGFRWTWKCNLLLDPGQPNFRTPLKSRWVQMAFPQKEQGLRKSWKRCWPGFPERQKIRNAIKLSTVASKMKNSRKYTSKGKVFLALLKPKRQLKTSTKRKISWRAIKNQINCQTLLTLSSDTPVRHPDTSETNEMIVLILATNFYAHIKNIGRWE